MGKARSLVFAALGAATLSYGAYEFNARYSRESIFERQQVAIEHVYRVESAARTRAVEGPMALIGAESNRADSNKARNLQNLNTGLSSLSDSSINERCEFEAQFESQLLANSRPTNVRPSGDFRPIPSSAAPMGPETRFPHCSTESMLKDTTSEVTAFVGLSALLVGLYNLLKRKKSLLGKELDRRMKAMENERKDTLLLYGIAPGFAHTITSESLRTQSAYELHTLVHGTPSLLAALENYGFTKSDIQRILLCFPPLLNLSPAHVCDQLSVLEDGGIKTPQEVMSAVVRLPAILGQ
jgi:hypothetical protein